MRRLAVGLAGVLVAAVGAWQGDALAATVADLEGRVAAIEERLAGRTVPSQEAEGLSFAGRDFAVSEPFDLGPGGAVVSINAPTKLMAVKFVSAPGGDQTYNTVVFTGNWPHVGTSAVTVNYPGRYVLAVEAVGDWTVEIEQ